MPTLRTDRAGMLATLQQHAASYRTLTKARRLAIERALIAGLPISKIAEASGLTWVRIWQIKQELGKKKQEEQQTNEQ